MISWIAILFYLDTNKIYPKLSQGVKISYDIMTHLHLIIDDKALFALFHIY